MQTNTVEVDPHAIDATLENMIEASGQPSPFNTPPAPAEQSTGIEIDWSSALDGVVTMAVDLFAPNWDFTEEEKKTIATSGAQTLQAFFPNLVLEGKWLALFVFAVSTGGIISKRRDSKTGEFKPRHLPKVAANESKLKPDAPTPAPAPAGVVVDFPAGRVIAPAWVGHGL